MYLLLLKVRSEKILPLVFKRNKPCPIMRTMKKLLTSIFFLLAFTSLFSQIKYKIEVLPDGETYLVSFVSSETYNAPLNKVASGQITIRMPHGVGVNSFQVTDLTMETPGAEWQAADVVNAPPEAPSFDYVSFGLITAGTDVYDFQTGVEIPVFSFKNGADFCADSIEIIRNNEDPFSPPNSLGANVGNTIVVLGAGFVNAFSGTIGTGVVPCTPGTLCTDETVIPVAGCESLVYQGLTFTQDTVIDLHYTSSTGCDSVFLAQITIEEALFTMVDTFICEGEIFKGIEILQEEEIMETFTSSNGCDSTVTYHITVLQPTSSNSDMTVLAGQLVNGIQVFSDTTVIATLVNEVGCDSIATVDVTIFNIPTSTVNAELCLGESYDGIFFIQDSSYVDTLVSVTGFDSLVVTNVSVFDTYFISNNVFLCEGEIFNGVPYFTDTSFSEDLMTVQGCDSVITTNILVLVPEIIPVDTAICFGETFLGILYQEDTVFTETIISGNGCDSLILQTNLHVTPAVNAIIDGDTEICSGDTTTLTALGGISYLWSTGINSNSIVVSGATTVSVTVTNAGGCEDIASAIILESGLSAQANVVNPRCNGDLSGSINFTEVSGGFEPYVYSIDGGNFFTTEAEFENLSPGEFSLEVMDAFGCYWQEIVEMTVPDEIWLDAGAGEEINLGESVFLRAFTNLSVPDSIIWSPSDGLECPNCLETSARPLETTTYRIVVLDENGCSSEAKVTIVVRSGYNVFVPNIFSPNGDGFNDSFTVFSGDNVQEVLHFTVFERWGGQVFSTKNIQTNDLAIGWHGEWRGKSAPEGTYVWMAEVEFIDGHIELFEGSVGLVR